LDDGPDYADEAADCDSDDLSWVAHDAVACISSQEEVLKPIVNSKHIDYELNQ
jgi:hypothetical protein